MILEKLKINLETPFILGVMGLSAVGKSTLLTIIASELINKGYSIAFITEESSRVVFRRLKNLVYVSTPKCKVFRSVDGEINIQNVVNLGNFDFVLCDCLINDEVNFLDKVRNLSNKQKISFLFTFQSKKFISNELMTTKNSLSVDYVINLIKRRITWFDKLKAFFGFKIKNRTLKMVKNRSGLVSELNYFVDFNILNR